MTETTIAAVDAVYRCSQTFDLTVHKVRSPDLRSFGKNLERINRSLGESAEDDFWSADMRRLKRFWFDLRAAPLLDAHLQKAANDLAGSLKRTAANCTQVYPSVAKSFVFLVDHLTSLSGMKLDYLLDMVVDIAERQEDMTRNAILVSDSRLVPLVENTIRSKPVLRGSQIVTPLDLQGVVNYESIIAVGASRWFPDHVFSAPRAPRIYLVRYQWIRDSWSPSMVLPDSVQASGPTRKKTIAVEDDVDEADIDDLLPHFEFQRIARKAAADLIDGDDHDSVDARIFLLEDEWAVFLEADDSATSLIIDLDEDVSERVRRVNVDEIEPGMFILLRTGGGGDYIVTFADRILADRVRYARECQREWKQRLRKLVRKTGAAYAVQELKDLGSIRANEPNLRHWMSERGIKTHSEDDFVAIMRLVGLEAEAETYWQVMVMISEAHRQAGIQIRRLLLDQVSKSDLRKLRRTGKMDFKMSGEEAGSLTAFRVRKVSPDVSLVSTGKIGDPFKLEDYD